MDFCYNLAGNLNLDRLMLAVSWLGDGAVVPVLLTLLTAAIFFFYKKRHFALALVVAPLVGNLVKTVLKSVVARPRPGWEGCRSLVNLSDYSFPSGHTIFYTIYFGLLAWFGFKYLEDKWYGKIISIASLILIVLVGLSRIYIGAHWASDVLAGYAIGGIILFATIYLLNKYPDKV